MRTDIQTDGQTEKTRLIGSLRNFANAPTNRHLTHTYFRNQQIDWINNIITHLLIQEDSKVPVTSHYQHKPASTSSSLGNQTTRSIVLIRNGVCHHDSTPDRDEVLIRILQINKTNISGGKCYIFSSLSQYIA